MISITSGPVAASALLALAREAVVAAEAVLAAATAAVQERHDQLPEGEQRSAHGLAWLATYVEAIRQLCAYVERLDEAARFGEVEQLLLQVGLSEYLGQILGGIPMNQTEIVRPADFGLTAADLTMRLAGPIERLAFDSKASRARLVTLMAEGVHGTGGEFEETLASVGGQSRMEPELYKHSY